MLSQVQVDSIIALSDANKQGSEIAASLGISASTVSRILKIYHEKGIRVARAEPLHARVWEMHQQGVSAGKIAEMVQRSEAQIHRIIKAKRDGSSYIRKGRVNNKAGCVFCKILQEHAEGIQFDTFWVCDDCIISLYKYKCMGYDAEESMLQQITSHPRAVALARACDLR